MFFSFLSSTIALFFILFFMFVSFQALQDIIVFLILLIFFFHFRRSSLRCVVLHKYDAEGEDYRFI